MSTEASSPREARTERTRAAIVAAAELRFSEHGYEGTRLEDVGEDVGLGRSAILYHYEDKRALYQAVLDDLFGGLMQRVTRAFAGPGDLGDHLEAAVSETFDYIVGRPATARIAMREIVSPDASMRDAIRAQSVPFLDLLDRLLEDGKKTGAIAPLHDDPRHFLSTVSGSTLFYLAAIPIVFGSADGESPSAESLAIHKREVVELTWRGLGIQPSTAARTRSTNSSGS